MVACPSLVSPDILASNIIQFNDGGIANIVKKIIKSVKLALKLLLFTFLLMMSTDFIPEYSNLIICKPIKLIINGRKKLIVLGKNDEKLTLKKLRIKTSNIPKKTNAKPIYK